MIDMNYRCTFEMSCVEGNRVKLTPVRKTSNCMFCECPKVYLY